MKSEKDSQAELDALLKEAAVQNNTVTDTLLPDNVARLFAGSTAASPNPAQPPVQSVPTTAALNSKEQPQEVAAAKDTPAASVPTSVPVAVPLADFGQPTIPTANELVTPLGKRLLTHFGQARPATKSKANRKLVLQLTPEMYQYFAHVVNLPGLDGVPLPDLAVAILHAWREDYRSEIKKANAAFKA